MGAGVPQPHLVIILFFLQCVEYLQVIFQFSLLCCCCVVVNFVRGRGYRAQRLAGQGTVLE